VESEHDVPKQTEKTQEARKENPETTEAPEKDMAHPSRGRLFLVLLVAAIVILGAYLTWQRSRAGSAAGVRATPADITLVTADRTDLDCVASKTIQGFHCGFSSETKPWETDERTKLKPYYTVDRHLYLIPGLFLEPAILNRYQAELPNKPREQLKRFTAHCQIKVIGKMTGARTHWVAGSAWSNPEDVDVGVISGCKIEG
jgi:hypothetical protein